MALPDDVRTACARVAARARHVRVVDAAIAPYAQTLSGGTRQGAGGGGAGPAEPVAAFSLQLNAVNFGSGWFPTLRKPAGLSGFRTVEAGLRAHGPWPARELRTLDTRTIAAVLGQDPDHPLMARFAAALRELGEHVEDVHAGAFARVAASGSAVAVAEELARLPLWHDVSTHAGEPVPFFKRAQLAAADLLPHARDLARLTLMADNLVPHVLRLDGVLEVEPALVARIERGELLAHGTAEEVELRACAVEAVERLVAAHGATTAAAVDELLWTRGGAPRYKARPRHRARTTAY